MTDKVEINITIGKRELLAFTLIAMFAAGSATLTFQDTNINFQNPVDMNNNRITQLAAPSNPTDAATLAWTGDKYINRSGDNITGNLNLNDNQITNISNPDDPGDVPTKDYVDSMSGGSSEPFTSSGPQGEVTDSGGKFIAASSYKVTSGSTVNVDEIMVVFASDNITINGEINADGEGESGGSGGEGDELGQNGDGGTNGAIVGGGGDGGSGGDGGEYEEGWGGSGGGSDWSSTKKNQLGILFSPAWDPIFDTSLKGGAGGGGGGGGECDDCGTDAIPGDGGSGGTGGGTVVLVSPEIKINGEINARGTDGSDGGNADCPNSDRTSAGGGGGGGGGTGGLVVLGYEQLTNPGTINLTGGEPGEGGLGTESQLPGCASDPGEDPNDYIGGEDGSDGSPGDQGEVFKVDFDG